MRLDVLHLMMSFNIGGKERVLSDMMQARAGGPVRYGVVIVNESHDEGLVQRLRDAGVALFLLGRREGDRGLAPLKEFARIVRETRPRVLHIRQPDAIPLALMAKAVSPGTRLFASFHNMQLVSRLAGWKIAAYRLFFDRIVAISEAVKAECTARGIADVTVLNNAVDVGRFASVPRKVADGEFAIICVARYLLRQKAQDVLLDAVAEGVRRGLPLRCRLLGALDGRNEADHRALVEQAGRLGIADRVEFVANRTDVERFLAQSDLFVLPSRFEGFGNVVIEAMAAGVPVLVSRVDGMREIVTEGVDGLFAAPGDAGDLADRIEWAFRHPEELARMAATGREHARRFDIGSYAARYEELYGFGAHVS